MTILKSPFRLLILGRPHSGKTYTLINALTKSNVFGTFTDYILLSPTAFSHRNKVWSKLPLKAENVHTKWSLALFEKVYAKQCKRVQSAPSLRPLIIIDDCGGLGLRGANPLSPTPLDHALTTCTHHNITIVLISQMVNLLPTSARACAEGIMIYEPPNSFEADNLYRAFGTGKHSAWLQQLQMCTEQDYNFMFIDKSGPKIKQYHNLDQPLENDYFVKSKRKREDEESSRYADDSSDDFDNIGRQPNRKRSRSGESCPSRNR